MVARLSFCGPILSDSFSDDQERVDSTKIERFVYPWDRSKSVPKTEFTYHVEAERFQFEFEVDDDDIVYSQDWQGESTLDDEDRVEIFFARDPMLKEYYCIEIDSAGRVHDYKASYYRKFDSSWNCSGLETKGSRTQAGYRVTGSVPIAVIRELTNSTGDQELEANIGLFRAEFYGTEKATRGDALDNWLSWIDPKTDKADFHIPQCFGRLKIVP
jgi:hypothetical protein